ncbi:DNA polymerase III subunit delta [Ferruginivarius sediminum]|uniref:DNA polymerase III subunit delta n=1 Tax=Ferruginivarius sediminum TaxID=2661937 RepID=A0A369TF88_9PROT|nr:DNA polymerase III subunit delta [Ferruginivarius sediminum]RDD63254.1 DNA polymerase III subunit delta [Ferruginivarius sediminum]
MKIKPAQADAFARKPDPKIRAVLVYGPDRGLVRERVGALIASVVDDPHDPFRVAELSSSQVAKEPALIADEAAALSFGGGRRVVWLRDAGEDAVKGLSAFLGDPVGDALVVVEAAELDTRSKLRQLFEKSDAGAALACYRDDARSLPNLIRETLREHGLEVSGEAVDYLASQLGGDRLVTRSELRKLAFYKGGGRVELADARECVGDTAALSLDDVALSCADGDLPALERAFDRALQEGANPVQPLRAAARHFQKLHLVAGASNLDQAIDRLRPPIFWKNKPRFKAQAEAWTSASLARALEILLEAEGRVKSTGLPAEAISARALMEIAARSPRRKRRR